MLRRDKSVDLLYSSQRNSRQEEIAVRCFKHLALVGVVLAYW
jgi:hypothetical protein